MNSKYDHLMGMLEMELAVEVMVGMADEAGITIDKLRVGPDNFVERNGERFPLRVLVGFCQLLAHGWVEPDYPNCYFIPSKGLIGRLNERWGTSYQEPKHLWEHAGLSNVAPIVSGQIGCKQTTGFPQATSG